MSYNEDFEDVMDSINNIAKGYGYVNGMDWAKDALDENEINYGEFKNFQNAHNLRIRFSHGNARDISISRQTLNIVYNFENKIKYTNLRKHLKNVRLPDGGFRGRPYIKEFIRKGGDGENYYFKFAIYKEKNYLDDGYGGDTAFGYFIHILDAPYFGYAKERLHEFHIISANSGHHICWDKVITDFERANAVMFVWVNRYTTLIDVIKNDNDLSEKELLRRANRKNVLPSGTFRAKKNNYRKEKQKYRFQKKTIYLSEGIYNELISTLGKSKPELGGMLGFTEDQSVVDHYVFDKLARVNQVEYNPNIDFLNDILENDWSKNHIYLAGFVHSHPGNFNILSYADIEYSQRIMDAFDMDYLFMPIVTSSYEYKTTFNPYIITKYGNVEKVNLEILKDKKNTNKNAKNNKTVDTEDNTSSVEDFESFGKDIDPELLKMIEAEFDNMDNIFAKNKKDKNKERDIKITQMTNDKKLVECDKNTIKETVKENDNQAENEIVKGKQNSYKNANSTQNIDKNTSKIIEINKNLEIEQHKEPVKEQKEDGIYSRVSSVLDIDYLKDCSIIGIGCGGARSFYESMARMGVGNFYLMDGDISSKSNIASQNGYLHELGMKKVDAIKDRLLDIDTNINVNTFGFMLEDNIDDEYLEKEIISKVKIKNAIVCAFTDNFYAQARISRIALKYKIPFISAQHHQFGDTAEVIFWYPKITKYSQREIAKSRYEAHQNGYKNDVTSDGSPIFNTTRLNALCEKIAMGMLLFDKYPTHEYSTFLNDMNDKNLILIKQKYLNKNHNFYNFFNNSVNDYFDDVLWVNPESLEDLENVELEENNVGDTRDIF